MSRTSPETETLLHCPFCGGKADLSFEHSTSHPDWWKVTCVECGCRTVTNTTSKAKAIERWNTRGLAQTPAVGICEALALRLRDAMQTAQNDDLSEPYSEKRCRHAMRIDAMLDAAEYLEEMASALSDTSTLGNSK